MVLVGAVSGISRGRALILLVVRTICWGSQPVN